MTSWCKPTVVPVEPFDPKSDAELVRKALKESSKSALIDIITKRNFLQRIEISEAYKNFYGKDLCEDFKSKFSGNFKEVMIALMTPLPEYYAKELYRAMDGLGTDENALIEILCSLSGNGIKNISQCYEGLYGHSLEKDLKGDTSGHFKRLCVSLCQGNRPADQGVDEKAAEDDANELIAAGIAMWGTNESTFNKILINRPYQQLRRIFEKYEEISGEAMEKSIKDEFSGDVRKGLLAIVKVVRSKPCFFAEALYKSMKGLGTDDKTLIRIIVSRCEIDLGNIKETFENNYGKSLASWIKGDTSGDYRKCLLSIVED